MRYGINTRGLDQEKEKLRLGLFVFTFLILFVVLVALTGLGLGFDATVWNAPGTPILSSQVLLCLLIAALILLVAIAIWRRWRKGRFLEQRLDLILAGMVWLIAAGIWLMQPAPSTYYSSPPVAPNYQSFPLSDAFNHDAIANNVLIGEGFRFGDQVAIRRPAYVLFLAGLEGFLGGDYDGVVIGQVLGLALFPAFLYLLGAKLHNRFSGLLLAGIVILREANSIVLGNVINTSHARLLMADLPTAMLMAALALAVVSWLRSSPRNWMAALLVGGLLGWSILLRSQSLTLIPFVLLLVVLVWGWRLAWRPAALFVLGVLLVASPWILRNRALIGQWAIEDAVVSGFLANRYSFTPGTYVLPFLPGESEGEYYARQMGRVREFTLQNPGYVAGFVADNYVRNQMLNFMAMPLSLQLRDLESHVRELPFWPGWEGDLPGETVLPMAANLLLVAIGLAVAWKKVGWVGLVPLFISLGFTINLALARVSGWRYNLPMDWSVLLYYTLGLGQLVIWILLLFHNLPRVKQFLAKLVPIEPKSRVKPKSQSIGRWPLVIAALLLLMAGSSFSIIEALNVPRYAKVSSQHVLDALSRVTLGNSTDKQRVLNLFTAGGLNVIGGRALHPRYYRVHEGLPDRNFLLVSPMDFARLTFYLLGPEPGEVILPLDSLDAEFPASSDVYVFHCGKTLDAAAVIVKESDGSLVLLVSAKLDNCSAPDS
ncbi:MAG: hypothetical protein WEA61_07045 [Anaerolineales bacterium]